MEARRREDTPKGEPGVVQGSRRRGGSGGMLPGIQLAGGALWAQPQGVGKGCMEEGPSLPAGSWQQRRGLQARGGGEMDAGEVRA